MAVKNDRHPKKSVRPVTRRASQGLRVPSMTRDKSERPAAMPPFVVSEIPWERLKRSDLEACLFWLLDAMGAKELTWRRGGSGHGTSDQGRDLECLFYASDPDGEMQQQRWWIEAKGRTGTVEPSAVKDAVVNASANREISTLVIATNTQFSNPTIDWVQQWSRNSQTSGLCVRLWDRVQLERLICRHPEVIFRIFSSDVLDAQGRAEVIRSRFLNRSERAGEKDLRFLWDHAGRIQWSEDLFLAVLVAEFENGDIGSRPWGMVASGDKILATLGFSLVNLLYFVVRRTRHPVEQSPYLSAVSYLSVMALTIVSAERLATYYWDVLADLPDLRYSTIKPVVDTMLDELLGACSGDCERILYCGTREPDRSLQKPRADYWSRFLPPQDNKEDDKTKRSGALIISENSKPCKIDLQISQEGTCPIADCDIKKGGVDELVVVLGTVAAVLAKRISLIQATRSQK